MFEAFALSTQTPSARLPGEIYFNDQILSYRALTSESVLPEPLSARLEDLKISFGGTNNEFLVLEASSFGPYALYSKDPKLLSSLARIRTLAPSLAPLLRAKKRSRTLLWASGFLLGSILFGLLSTRNAVIRHIAQTIPPQWETQIGDQLFKVMSAQQKIIPLKDLKNPDFERLLFLLKPRGLTVDFYVSSSSEINAFAFPGNRVVLNQGLLRKAKSVEEILGVVAHELGHVSNRHIIQSLIRSAGLFLAIQTLMGDVSGILAVLADNGAFLLNQKYSRDFEREADDFGFELLVRAKISPQGLISFFETLKKQEEELLKTIPGGEVVKQLSFLNTHPATDERIQHLKELQTQSSASISALDLKPLAFDLKTFQNSLNL